MPCVFPEELFNWLYALNIMLNVYKLEYVFISYIYCGWRCGCTCTYQVRLYMVNDRMHNIGDT